LVVEYLNKACDRMIGQHPIANNVVAVINDYISLRTTQDRKYIKQLADTCENAARNIRSFDVREVTDTAKEVTEFLGEEHEPGNPRIPGWRRDYELEVEEIRKWRNIIDPTKYVTVCKSAVGYDSLTPSGYTAPVSTQREAISKAVEWMRAHPNPPFPPPYR